MMNTSRSFVPKKIYNGDYIRIAIDRMQMMILFPDGILCVGHDGGGVIPAHVIVQGYRQRSRMREA